MNYLVAVLITSILGICGMLCVYTLLDPYSIIAVIAGGLVGIVSALIGLQIGENYT